MLKRLVAIFSTLLIAGMVAGCSANFVPSDVTPEQTPIGVIQGNVHGGNFPVIGAQIYLFAAGQGGYNTSATSLITSGGSGVSCSSPVVANACYVTTDGNGNFSVGGDYFCTSGTQVYMVAVAGNPGLTGSTTNSTFATNSSTITVVSATGISIGSTASGSGVSGVVTAVSGTTVTLSNKTTSAGSAVPVTFSVYNNGAVQMAALGQCPAGGSMASKVPYLVINEVTTVAFAYSVGGFATTAYNVSSDAAGETAIATAFANAGNIVTLGDGQANPTATGNASSVAPQSKINSLANILATCVNTQPLSSTQASTLCTSLFKAATTSTGTVATDEANAIFNVVHNQAQNVTTIFNLGGSTGPFSPTLSAAPTDWTMPVIYKNVVSTPNATSPVTSGPYNIAFDASGDAWIGDRVNGVVEIGAQGAVRTLSNASEGFSMVKGVAVSPQDGTIWVTDFGKNEVDVMTPEGTILANITQHMKPYGPVSTVFALNPLGTGDYLAYEVDETTPGIVVIDSGSPYTTVDHYAGNTNSPQDFSGVSQPGWIYVDSTGVVWIPSTNTTYAGELGVTNKTGTVKYAPTDLNLGASYSTIAEQLGMAADGLGNVWAGATIPGYGAGLYELKGGASTGESTGGGLNNPYKTSVDGGNNVWVANGGANTVSGLNTTSGNWFSPVGFSTSSPGITTTGTFVTHSTSVSVGSSTGIAVGATVSGAGIPSGTTVSTISGTTVTLSQATTAAGSNVPVTFGTTGCVVIGVDPSGDVWTGNSDETVTELLGLATPTAAPLYGGKSVNGVTTNGNLGTKP